VEGADAELITLLSFAWKDWGKSLETSVWIVWPLSRHSVTLTLGECKIPKNVHSNGYL
jgi:hypothetical protein